MESSSYRTLPVVTSNLEFFKMHTDLSPHLHNEKCNELIQMLQRCHAENPFRRFFGWCNAEDHKMVKCLDEERSLRRRKNYEKSLQTKERLRQKFKEDREREKASNIS